METLEYEDKRILWIEDGFRKELNERIFGLKWVMQNEEFGMKN